MKCRVSALKKPPPQSFFLSMTILERAKKTAWNLIIVLRTINERAQSAVFNHQILAFACLAYAVLAWPLLVVAGVLLVILGAGLVIGASAVTAILSPVLVIALQSGFAATWGFWYLFQWILKLVGKYVISEETLTVKRNESGETITWNEKEVVLKQSSPHREMTGKTGLAIQECA